MKEWNAIGNFKKISEYQAVLAYDVRIYTAEVINAVAQYMIGKCKIILDMDESNPNKILVEIISDNPDVDQKIFEFSEEIINYSFYHNMMEKKGKIRETILERVLLCVQNNSVASSTNYN